MRIRFLEHICKKIKTYWTLRNSGLFDADWYIENYPECKRSILSPYWYYVFKGYKLGHNPSPLFIGKLYWQIHASHNTDRCPLIHFALYGDENHSAYYGQKVIDDGCLTDKEFARVKYADATKPKILLVSHESSLTGAPRALLNMAEVLQAMGAYVVFWTMKDGPLKYEVQSAGIEYKFPALCFSKLSEDERYVERGCEYVNQFDFVLLNTIVAIPYIDVIAKCRAKKLSWIHDGKVGFSSWGYAPDFPEAVEKFDRALIVGNYAKTIALSYAHDKGVFSNLYYYIPDIHGESDVPAFWPVNNAEHKVKMVMAGTIEERKGHGVLLKSLKLMPQEVKDRLSIIVVGSCVTRSLGDALEECNEQCLSVLGPKNHDELLSYIKSMDILLCPSTDDPMPIVCTESMMFSTPVIVGSKTGTALFIDQHGGGFVVESGNPESLAAAMAKAVEQREMLPNMGLKARRIFEENFTRESFESELKKIFF